MSPLPSSIEPLKAPTDNLYKVVAISGLLLAVVTGYYMASLIQEVRTRMIDVQGDLAILDAKVRWLDQQADSHDRALAVLEQMRRAGKTPSRALIEKSEREADALAAASRESQDLQTRIRGARARVHSYIELFQEYRRWFLAGTSLGMGISILGFMLWYWKLQRHQDRALARSASTLDQRKPSPADPGEA
jgi:hypothetical protein